MSRLTALALACASLLVLDACSAPDPSEVAPRAKRRGATGASEEPSAGDGEANAADNGNGTGNGNGNGTGNGNGGGTGNGNGGGNGNRDGGAGSADAAAPGDFTNGSGGPTGLIEARSSGGLSYQINAPAGATPRGLLVLLHGSGASNYANFVRLMERAATTHDLIRVSVLAPNGQGWNEGNQQSAANLLHQLVQQDLYPRYNIDRARVLFSGQSSGGGFLGSHFVPLYAKQYRGGAFLQCGMAPPFQTFAPDDATKRAFRMHMEITTGDTIWPQSYRNAVAAYTTAGVQFTRTDTKPGGHCAFDQQQVILDNIGFILGPR